MKKALILFLLTAIFNVHFLISAETVKIKDIRAKLAAMSESDLSNYSVQIKGKAVEMEKGWIASIKNFDSTSDIVYVELDRPDPYKLVPDLSFVIDKKISKRLSELQMLYFNATIEGYDEETKILKVKDIFLSGIMR